MGVNDSLPEKNPKKQNKIKYEILNCFYTFCKKKKKKTDYFNMNFKITGLRNYDKFLGLCISLPFLSRQYCGCLLRGEGKNHVLVGGGGDNCVWLHVTDLFLSSSLYECEYYLPLSARTCASQGEDETALRQCYDGVERDGEVIRVRDTVLLRSGPRKKSLPYVAKISALWEDPKTGITAEEWRRGGGVEHE